MPAKLLLHYILRIAVAMCFIGHGAFGILTKPIWCNYFAVFGIGHDLAYRLMPVVGAFDIAMGVLMLLRPMRAIAGWLVIWGIVTALLRPLSGEPLAEFLERAGNFGAPLAFLLLSGGNLGQVRSWFARVDPAGPAGDGSGNGRSGNDYRIDPAGEDSGDRIMFRRLQVCLRIVVFLLLLGHGWLNLLGKKGLLDQYAALGFSHPGQVAQWAGICEILAALTVLIRPVRPLLLVFLVWKMGSELFYPHHELLEWVERGGSYGSVLAGSKTGKAGKQTG